MRFRTRLFLAILAASFLSAQPAPKRTPEQMDASWQAHKSDFDYLLGDWEFTSESKEWGKGRGRWSAVKLNDGQILDEYRVLGDKDETYYVTTTIRNFNRFYDRWELIGADPGSGLKDFGTAVRNGDELRIEQTFGASSDKPRKARIRYYNIRPDSFSWTADISLDGGKTWIAKQLTIEAKRIGPARSMEALTATREK
ncbi:MAG: hypothetical protein JOZ54_20650 [Acidobacteria bacterium]|nr:hypothetical protein [Acidobacteriota bacterium]